MTTPMIDRVLRNGNPPLLLGYLLMDDRTTLVTELRALLADRDTWRSLANANAAERDRWKAKAEAAQPRPVREYKGVTFVASPTGLWRYEGCLYHSASALIARHYNTFTDADHAELLKLRDDPWEKGETVEEVVQAWWRSQNCYEIRTADLCARLRAAFPCIEQPRASSFGDCQCGITFTGHVNALVKMGATKYPDVWFPAHGKEKYTVLILPSEAA